jgi:GT2 family glycosyltransferase
MPSASVIVVNTNDGRFLFECLDRVAAAGGFLETILVDNASTDGSRERVEADYPWVRVIETGYNAGYTGANNLGSYNAKGEVLIYLNPDAYVTPGWLEALLSAFDDPNVAIASPKIYRGLPGTTDLFDSAGGDLEFPLGEGPPRGYLQKDTGQFQTRADVAYSSGTVFAIRASIFKQTGGLDEDFFCYCEESDLCWRARMAGLRCVYEPSSLVYHLGSMNFGAASPRKIYYQTRNRIVMSLQNLETRNLPAFVASELVHGLAVMLAAPFFPKYRQLGLAYARAWAGVVAMLPTVLWKRAKRQRERSLGDDVVLALHKRVSVITMLRRYAGMVEVQANSLYNPAAQLP